MSDSALSREWFSAAELADEKLPEMPATKANVLALAARRDWLRPEWQGRYWRKRQAAGGGVELHYSVLPHDAQTALALRLAAVPANAPEDAPLVREAAAGELERAEAWQRFERTQEKCEAVLKGGACTGAACAQRCQGVARARLAVLQAIEALEQGGMGRVVAIMRIAMKHKLSKGTIYNWFSAVRYKARADRLAYLVPHHVGSAASADMSDEAWEWLKANWLRPEKPPFAESWRLLKPVAKEKGWTLPAPRTAERRLLALPVTLRVLRREGEEALKRMYPAQERDRSVFRAMEWVCSDGHTWDLFVKWPDGTIDRPKSVPFQDLYSGKWLSLRHDQTLHAGLVRLAFGDMVERYGIPDACLMDNGREFAGKLMTGGMPKRFRFKVRAEEPDGIMKQLGTQVHWATPYAGQSKPIERSFRDWAHGVAKHPAFAGAYTGHNPLAKPENYGQTAVPLEVFDRVVGEAMAEWNARPGRNTRVCRVPGATRAEGRSFDQVFIESYEANAALIRRATPEQQRLWLMAAEAVSVSRVDGGVRLLGNRYHATFLYAHRGQKVMVRFDPDAVQEDLHVYRLDGTYLGAAECIEAVGFNDTDAAREHGRARRAWVRGEKMKAEAEVKMKIGDVAALIEKTRPPQAPELPTTTVVRGVFGTAGNTALKPVAEQQEDDEDALMAGLRVVQFRPRAVEAD